MYVYTYVRVGHQLSKHLVPAGPQNNSDRELIEGVTKNLTKLNEFAWTC